MNKSSDQTILTVLLFIIFQEIKNSNLLQTVSAKHSSTFCDAGIMQISNAGRNIMRKENGPTIISRRCKSMATIKSVKYEKGWYVHTNWIYFRNIRLGYLKNSAIYYIKKWKRRKKLIVTISLNSCEPRLLRKLVPTLGGTQHEEL